MQHPEPDDGAWPARVLRNRRLTQIPETEKPATRLQFMHQRLKLPLRQAEGFPRSVLSLMALGLEAPDHTTVSRHSQQVDVGLRLAATKGHLHLITNRISLAEALKLETVNAYRRQAAGEKVLTTPAAPVPSG